MSPIGLYPQGLRSQVVHLHSVRPTAPLPDRRDVESRYVLTKVIVTVAGVAGFLGLLLAGAYVSSGEEVLRISAFAWFFGFGALRVVLDVRASRASRRRGTCSGQYDRRVGAGLF
jgi:hypothetical protein